MSGRCATIRRATDTRLEPRRHRILHEGAAPGSPRAPLGRVRQAPCPHRVAGLV